tara:strand:- start:797 stop:1021 length:225 start_codon:yes stop_codon:yes gene_type:complete
MQKLINALAIVSFVGTAGIVGGGVFVYLQRDTIIDGVKEKIKEQVMNGVTGALPGLVDSAVPKLPSATGPALPF